MLFRSLFDDAYENGNKTFANQNFRTDTAFDGTFLGEKFKQFGEDPQSAINGVSNFLGLGNVVQPLQRPTTPNQEQESR